MTSPPCDLSGKVAVVTGGAGIIGAAVCRAMVASGARVAVIDIDRQAAAKAADEITGAAAGQVAPFACDVSDPESVKHMTAEVVGTFGGIHVLHNNAATKGADLDAYFEPFETFSLKVWREVMAVNLDGMFLVCQSVGRQMVEQGVGGSIIQTASIYGVVAPDFGIYEGSEYMGRPITTPAIYSASKAGVVGLSKYLAAYWAPRNIRVNSVVPGGVESGQNAVFQQRYGQRAPLGRMARRDEIAGAVVFLASDAASYITGQTLAVDGGWTVW